MNKRVRSMEGVIAVVLPVATATAAVVAGSREFVVREGAARLQQDRISRTRLLVDPVHGERTDASYLLPLLKHQCALVNASLLALRNLFNRATNSENTKKTIKRHG